MIVFIFLDIDVMLDSSFTFPSAYLQIQNMLLWHFTQVLHSDVIQALPVTAGALQQLLMSWTIHPPHVECYREREMASGLLHSCMECSQSKHM